MSKLKILRLDSRFRGNDKMVVKRKIIIALLVILLILGGLFYFRWRVYYSHGVNKGDSFFEVTKGEGNTQIAKELKQGNFISSQTGFYYYLWSRKLTNKILPGKYKLNGAMTIPEVASILTSPPENVVKITFPEGWDSQKIAERLAENNLDSVGFLETVKNPGDLINQYDFLKDSKMSSLEGYLFPDTYFFKKDARGQEIVSKMLDNFSGKITAEMRKEIQSQNRSMGEIITMASIIEKEVNNTPDRKIVSGIFWNRIGNGQAFQSCATLAYILGVNKKQYSYEDTRVKSPYNTYLNRGLPPGPISNPGLDSIQAAIYPTDSDYNYFLSDPETGKTYYAKTAAEHNANKARFGL